MARDPSADTNSPPDWEKKRKQAEAETSALEALKKLHDAKEALRAAETPLDPAKKALDDKLAAAKAAKDLADAEKAAADARKAQADASLAAFKASIGEVPSSGYTGGVTLLDKAGSMEAALLSAKATETAAQKIADALPQEANKTLLLYAAGEVPNFQAQIAFRAQITLVKKAFTDALGISDSANKSTPEPAKFKMGEIPVASAAGLILDAVNKLLGFFRTDYTFGGVEIKFEDSLLVNALAGKIADKKISVLLPAVYSPDTVSDSVLRILSEISDLSKYKVDAQAKSYKHEELSSNFTEEAGKETDPIKKAALLEKAKTHKAAYDALKAAMALYDDFFSKLSTIEDKGTPTLASVIREGIVAEELKKGSPLLLVKLHQSGGAYYTKKNLWTSIAAGPPLYHMGGVVVSFVLLDGRTGTVLKSGVVPVHGGFIIATDLPQEMERIGSKGINPGK